MKITPTMPGNRPTATTAGSSQPRKTTATTTTTLSADDITQAGLQSAQQTLNDQQESDIDSDKVAQMQAMPFWQSTSGHRTVSQRHAEFFPELRGR